MKAANNTHLIALLFLFSLVAHQSYSQNPWSIDKNKEGIKVYTRKKENSSFNAFKATVTLDASVDKILKVIRNVNNYTDWYGYTKTSKLLNQEQEAIQYGYIETVFPWPYSNRDMIYKMSVDTFANGKIIIALKGIPDFLKEVKGIIRMKKAEGYILLNPSGDRTEVIYEFHSEPGDDISPWLANKSIAELPFMTLSGLRKVLEENN